MSAWPGDGGGGGGARVGRGAVSARGARRVQPGRVAHLLGTVHCALRGQGVTGRMRSSSTL